jgi:integrase
MKLTTRNLATLKLPAGSSEALIFDEDVPGFGVRLRTAGSRVWIFQYRVGPKHRRITFGKLGAMGLQEARNKAERLHAQVRLGHDPAGAKAERQLRATETFEPMVKRFLARQKTRLKPRSYVEVERHLLSHAKPLHGLLLSGIDRRAIAGLLTDVGNARGPIAGNRVRASLSTLFAWAMREGLADANPVISTNRENEVTRDRVLTESELGEIWNALADDEYGDILKLLTLTAQRREEIGGLCWSEIDFRKGLMALPASRTKNRRPHEVPMSGTVRGIFENRLRRVGRDLIFGSGQGGFSGWSNAKDALDARILSARKAVDRKAKPMPAWRLHDLRRSAATHMAELGIAPHVIEAILNHVSGHKAGVAGIYNRSNYAAEKKAALTRWADHLQAIVDGQKSTVVSLKISAVS